MYEIIQKIKMYAKLVEYHANFAANITFLRFKYISNVKGRVTRSYHSNLSDN